MESPKREFEAQLAAGDTTFDARDEALLRAILDAESLNAAASELGRSYAHAHRRLGDLEDAFGPLVERTRGGTDGGGSRLTPNARELLAKFERLRAEFSGLTSADENVLAGEVVERDGELAVVSTDAGEVHALVLTERERVQVTIRADAVTLHATGEVPDETATSARNRLPGEVVGVSVGETVGRVAVDVGFDEPLIALVTLTSVERLALEPEAEVVASFKATATRATAGAGESKTEGTEAEDGGAESNDDVTRRRRG
ncbi:TOBE domain-containing protein [Halorussus amylolyticus]|uniref:TOBE domain-containing protein n=1 Tax=Halorussus amylolyticus TaxID=1126242 RepID=UPI0010513010|nr:TOBE domain-containing protein [Halorussus amylolyticus]